MFVSYYRPLINMTSADIWCCSLFVAFNGRISCIFIFSTVPFINFYICMHSDWLHIGSRPPRLLTNNRLHARPPTLPRRRRGTNRLLAASKAGDESSHDRPFTEAKRRKRRRQGTTPPQQQPQQSRTVEQTRQQRGGQLMKGSLVTRVLLLQRYSLIKRSFVWTTFTWHTSANTSRKYVQFPQRGVAWVAWRTF